MTVEIEPAWLYWGSALAVSSAVYGFIILFGKNHISDELNEDLTLWLWGEYESTWSEQFGRLFDTVFGKDHLSWKCFFRSSIASALAVLLLYVLFDGVLGVFGSRTEQDITMAQLLLFGIALNLVPDYLSLFETRWLLKRFEKVQSFFGQLGVLLVDAIFTGSIILIAIYVFQWVRGEEPLSVVETVALFSIFSIFFYSTFLTSVWAWLYCVSTWFMRLFARTSLKKVLKVEENPVAQIALVSFVFMFFLVLVTQSLFKKAEGTDLTVLDNYLCQTFPSDTVDHCVRLTNDDLAALTYLEKACMAGSADHCFAIAKDYYGGDERKTASLFRRACEVGNAFGCSILGSMYEDGTGVDVDGAKAITLYEQGCDGGDPSGCTSLGFVYEFGVGGQLDQAQAVANYAKGCEGGHAIGCGSLGFMYQNGNGVAVDIVRAVSLYERSCDLGDTTGCLNLGNMYWAGDGVSIDRPRAMALYELGCDRGYARGCFYLGSIYEQGIGVPVDQEKAAEYRQRLCKFGVEDAC